MSELRTHIDMSGEAEMSLLHESLARDRMREHERSLAEAHQRQAMQRVAVARRWQRRAEQASRRARSLLMSV